MALYTVWSFVTRVFSAACFQSSFILYHRSFITSSLLMAEYHLIAHHGLFTYSLFGGHLGRFHFSVITHNGSVNSHVQIAFVIFFSSSRNDSTWFSMLFLSLLPSSLCGAAFPSRLPALPGPRPPWLQFRARFQWLL